MSESIRLSEYAHENNCAGLHPDDWPGIRVIQQNIISFDSEKGFIDNEVIISLNDKFYRFVYTEFGCGDDDILEQTAKEVFKKTKVVEYYE